VEESVVCRDLALINLRIIIPRVKLRYSEGDKLVLSLSPFGEAGEQISSVPAAAHVFLFEEILATIYLFCFFVKLSDIFAP
jgi:hypothetical protein